MAWSLTWCITPQPAQNIYSMSFFWLLGGTQDKYHADHYLWQFWRGPCLSHCIKLISLISVRSSRYQGCDVNCRFVNTQLQYKLFCVKAVIKCRLLDLLCCVLVVVPAVSYQPLNSGKLSSLWCWIEADKVPDLPFELNWRFTVLEIWLELLELYCLSAQD